MFRRMSFLVMCLAVLSVSCHAGDGPPPYPAGQSQLTYPTAQSVELVQGYLETAEGREALRDLAEIEFSEEARRMTYLVLASQGQDKDQVNQWLAYMLSNPTRCDRILGHLKSVCVRPHWYSWGSVSIIDGVQLPTKIDTPAASPPAVASPASHPMTVTAVLRY